ncbi:MAG: hypothetical protein WCA95_09830 [Opitutaceae bacterium]
MKQLSFILATICGLMLAGCIPLQQTDMKGGDRLDGFEWYAETGYGLFWIGPSNVGNAVKIVDAKSYALGPNGVRYGVHSERHQFDIEQKYVFVRDEIHFLDAKGAQVSHLSTGVWQFSFTFVRDGKEEHRMFTGKLWTFYYVPIIDGPPN